MTKKLKMISIGNSDIQINDVGNPNLHKKRSVGIVKFDSTNVGRAIVFDQHLIDILYKDKSFDERQHSACNKYLSVIARGLHLSNPPFGERVSGNQHSSPVSKACILIKVQRHLKKSCGREIESRFWFLMTNSPRKIQNLDIQLMIKCADSLLNFYFIGSDSPVSLFRKALANQL